MKVKNPDAPVTNKIFWQGINAIIDLIERTDKKNQEDHNLIRKELKGEMRSGFDKLDRKIDNLAANTPTKQEFEEVKKLQVN